MNLDLALMTLESLAKSPVEISAENGSIVLEGEQAGFKDLARLLLLLGASDAEPGDEFVLEPAIHTTKGSATVRIRLR